MRTAPPLSECIDLRCKAPACLASQPPTVCPPGCPKERATQAVPQQSYKDIHAPAPSGGCLDCLRQEMNQPNYHSPRPCPPGTKPIPDRPLGGSSCDRIGSSDQPFLNTFDCHEQPWRPSKHRVEEHHDHGCQNVWKPTIRMGKMTGDNLGDFGQPQPEQEWRSSRTYIPCAHDYGKAWNWRPCIRQVGADRKHCDNTEWRSSVHVAGPPEGDSEKPHSNCIRYQPPTAPHGRRPPRHRFGQVSGTFRSFTRNEGTGESLKGMSAPNNVSMSSRSPLTSTDKLLRTLTL